MERHRTGIPHHGRLRPPSMRQAEAPGTACVARQHPYRQGARRPQRRQGAHAHADGVVLHREACRLLGIDPRSCPLLDAERWQRRYGFRPDGEPGVLGRARTSLPYAVWVAPGAPYVVHVHELLHVLMPLWPETWVHEAAETCCGLRQACGSLTRPQLLRALRWMARAMGISPMDSGERRQRI